MHQYTAADTKTIKEKLAPNLTKLIKEIPLFAIYSQNIFEGKKINSRRHSVCPRVLHIASIGHQAVKIILAI